jgi:CubicO group peptidase (beta-lactamase class C family)
MKNLLKSLLLATMMLSFLQIAYTQGTDRFPRSTPEMEGVSSSGIIDFLNAVDTSKVELHSFMVLRHGKVIAEGWWKPYAPHYRHIMYSASKTFTATAVGLAASENRLKLSDKVISFFPYSLPDSISDYMKELTVKDLLTMSVGHDPEPSAMGTRGDWVTKFLGTAPVHKPGTVFKYNNMATFMLSAIVQQVTGETLFKYLSPRIFKPLGIRGIDWDLNPQGINLGMIGLRLHTEDLAKLGQLLLNGGVWNKTQLVPKEWVKQATSFQIKNSDEPEEKRKLNDWAQGYGYQMWRGRYNTVRLDGLGGQFSILIPDKDAVVVCTSNAGNGTQKELNMIYEFLIPPMKSDKALAPDPSKNEELQKRLAALNISSGSPSISKSSLEAKISGKEFILGSNNHNIQSVYFTFSDGVCTFSIKRENEISSIKAGLTDWKISNTSTASLLAPSRNNFSKSIDASYSAAQPVIKLAAKYAWTEEKTMEITGRFVEETLGQETIVCRFSEQNNNVQVTIEPKAPATQSRSPFGPQQTVILRGAMVNIQ